MAANMASTEMGFEDDMDASRMELLEASHSQNLHTTHRRTVAFVACLFAMCATISGVSGCQPEEPLPIKKDCDGCIEIKHCSKLPYMKINKVVSSNLAMQGPDKDKEEGIIYDVTEGNTGIQSRNRNLQIHIHSLSSFNVKELTDDTWDREYDPAFKDGRHVNGIDGKFAIINVRPGRSLKLRAHAYDADAKQDLPLPHCMISFFDLDIGAKAIEHIKITGYKWYYVSNETEIKVIKHGRFTTFAATTKGDGEDNPTHPMKLTENQYKKAVTVEYRDVPYIDIEFVATEGYEGAGRVFSFVFRPSLLCHSVGGKLFPFEGLKVEHQ